MKNVWQWLKSPKIWWFAITVVIFAAEIVGVILLLKGTAGSALSVFAFLLFALSAITLAYLVYCIIYFVPKAKLSVTSTAQKHEFSRKLMEQYGFRTIIFAILSFTVNVGFVVYNGTIGIYYRSYWYLALGVYYLFLAIMRGGVLISHRRKGDAEGATKQIKLRETKTYLLCGMGLMVLPLAFSAVVWLTYATNQAFVHAGYMIYLFAAYAFYKIIMAVYNFVKARKGDEMTVRAIRNVNLANALVSLFALQTAMFHEFSPEANLGVGNAVTGAAVCALTAAIGIYMIIKGSSAIKQIKNEVENVREV